MVPKFAQLYILIPWILTEVAEGFMRGRPEKGFVGAPERKLNTVSKVSDNWFPQILDHLADKKSFWKQRYFQNEKFFKSSGPVFLMIGGEAEANKVWMEKGSWLDYAKQFGAVCFLLEHRYYGKSHPVKDLGVKNLQFLTSKQAIYDLANFVKYLRTRYKGSRVIVFGGSYAGNLAAWFRMKFPSLVDGAVSTSGPVLAKVNFEEYLGVVQDALGDECSLLVKKASLDIERSLLTAEGCKNISRTFHACKRINCSEDIDVCNFMSNIADVFEDVVQYNKDNRDSYLKNITIDTVCSVMTNETVGTPLTRLVKVVKKYNSAKKVKCLDSSYDTMIADMRNTSWGSTAAYGGRQWTYQTCNEFGYFQSSDLPGNLFEGYFPVTFYIQQCEDIFGPKFSKTYIEKSVEKTNRFYHGLDVQQDNKTIFINGSRDPWHKLSVTDKTKDNVFVITGTAHCANMYPERQDDPPELKSARKKVSNFIQSCLK